MRLPEVSKPRLLRAIAPPPLSHLQCAAPGSGTLTLDFPTDRAARIPRPNVRGMELSRFWVKKTMVVVGVRGYRGTMGSRDWRMAIGTLLLHRQNRFPFDESEYEFPKLGCMQGRGLLCSI